MKTKKVPTMFWLPTKLRVQLEREAKREAKVRGKRRENLSRTGEGLLIEALTARKVKVGAIV